MTSSFNVRHASGYEQLMGRWSRKLADPFIKFVGLEDGERVLDVGCGTGSLTFALSKYANVSEIAAIDFSPVFVEEAKRRNTDPQIDIKQGDATAIPYSNGHFDRAMALLVLHFVPEASKAVSEMRRVVKKNGIAAAAVWDHLGGMPVMRMVLDTMAPIDGAANRLRSHYCFQPMMRPGEMAATFESEGLTEVEETSILIRMDYASFDDFWAPISSGEGPLGKYIAGLDATTRAKADTTVRAAYESGQPDGPRSFVAGLSGSRACRGVGSSAGCRMSRISYHGYRFPPDIIQRAVWLYFRFTLSFRDVEDLLAERGIEVSYESIRQWVRRFGPAIARDLRSRRPRPHEQWHLDEMFVSIGGKWMYLWRAVDAEGEVLDCLVQSRRDKRAARKLMRKLLKKQGFAPSHLITDHLKSYPAAFQEMRLTAVHHRGKRANNRAESSHVPIRRRERKMQGFKSAKSAQRFLSAHGPIYNTFNTCRHLISAANNRTFRREAMTMWRQAASVAA